MVWAAELVAEVNLGGGRSSDQRRFKPNLPVSRLDWIRRAILCESRHWRGNNMVVKEAWRDGWLDNPEKWARGFNSGGQAISVAPS